MKSAIICLLVCFVAPLVSSVPNIPQFKANFGKYEYRMNDAINKQIQVELQGHYTYLYLSHTFNEKSRYYPKVASYFRAKADEEMQHAERFIQYQNQRGGTFALGTSVTLPAEIGCKTAKTLKDAFTCAQSLELFVTKELTNLAKLASDVKCKDTSGVDTRCDQCYDCQSQTANECTRTGCNSITVGEINDLMAGQSVLVTHGNPATTEALYKYYQGGATDTISKVEYIELEEMITHEFLGHQIEDTKEIANYLNTLTNFGKTPGSSSSSTDTDNVEKLASYLFDKNL